MVMFIAPKVPAATVNNNNMGVHPDNLLFNNLTYGPTLSNQIRKAAKTAYIETVCGSLNSDELLSRLLVSPLTTL